MIGHTVQQPCRDAPKQPSLNPGNPPAPWISTISNLVSNLEGSKESLIGLQVIQGLSICSRNDIVTSETPEISAPNFRARAIICLFSARTMATELGLKILCRLYTLMGIHLRPRLMLSIHGGCRFFFHCPNSVRIDA